MKGVFIANVAHVEHGATTFITFDQGGEWRKIPAPSVANGNPTNCKLVCTLELSNK